MDSKLRREGNFAPRVGAISTRCRHDSGGLHALAVSGRPWRRWRGAGTTAPSCAGDRKAHNNSPMTVAAKIVTIDNASSCTVNETVQCTKPRNQQFGATVQPMQVSMDRVGVALKWSRISVN